MAVCQSLGIQLLSSDLQKIRLTGVASSELSSFRNLGDKVSSPAALSHLKAHNLSTITDATTSMSQRC